MSNHYYAVVSSIEQMDCFGSFTKSNPLCAKYCALRIRCAIEQNQLLRTELIEELVDAEDILDKMQ